MEIKVPGSKPIRIRKNIVAFSSLLLFLIALGVSLGLVEQNQNIKKKAAGDSGPRIVCSFDNVTNCLVNESRTIGISTSLSSTVQYDAKGMTFDSSGNFRQAINISDSTGGLVYNTTDLLSETNKSSGTIAMWVKPNFDPKFGTQTSDSHVLFQMYQSETSRLNLFIRNGNELEFMLNNNDLGTYTQHGLIAKLNMAKSCTVGTDGNCCSGASCPALPPGVPAGGCKNKDDPVYDCLNDGITNQHVWNWNKGEWHWVVVSWGTQGSRLYVDGDLRDSDNKIKGGPSTFSPNVYIGVFRDGINNKANSSIDDLKIWDRQITDDEVHIAAKNYYYARQSDTSETRAYTSVGTISSNLGQRIVGSVGSLNADLVLTQPIQAGGGVRFLFKLGFGGWPAINTSIIDAALDGVVLDNTKDTTKAAYLSWCGQGTTVGTYCEIIAKTTLNANQKITLRFGKEANLFVFPRIAQPARIGVAINNGSGFFFEIAGTPYINMKAEQANSLAVFVTPSTVDVSTSPSGQPVPYIIVKAEDKYLNTADYSGTVTFSCDSSIKIIPEGSTTSRDLNGYSHPLAGGIHRFDNIIFSTPGQYRINITFAALGSGSTAASSNYVVVGTKTVSENDPYKLYWGDLHNHTQQSDGMGTIDSMYEYARNKSALNFAADGDHQADPNSDHNNPAFMENNADSFSWSALTKAATDWNKPGDFVAILGYEYGHGTQVGVMNCLVPTPGNPPTHAIGWTFENGYPVAPAWGDINSDPATWPNWTCAANPQGVNLDCANPNDDYENVEGDWNVYYNGDGPRIAPQNTLDLLTQVEEWKVRTGNSAFIVPHWGGRLASMSILQQSQALKNDPNLVPGIEVFSQHTSSPCSFETWAQRGINNWFNPEGTIRLGMLGGSDEHSSMAGRSTDSSRQGLLAVWSKDLTRDSIFEAISQRRFYTYSHGARPIIEFFATDSNGNRHVMGEEIVVGSVKPKIGFSVLSSVGIKSIEIIKGTASGDTSMWKETYPSPGTTFEKTRVNLSDLITDSNFSANSYYYLKVITGNWGTAWTSPIWVKNATPTPTTSSCTPENVTFNPDPLSNKNIGQYQSFSVKLSCLNTIASGKKYYVTFNNPNGTNTLASHTYNPATDGSEVNFTASELNYGPIGETGTHTMYVRANSTTGTVLASRQFTVASTGATSTPMPTPTPGSAYQMRVNVGGPNTTDNQGRLWLADKVFVNGSWGYVGGGQYSTGSVITVTDTPVLYQTERFSLTSYKFTVPNGGYNVTLKFAEIYTPNCVVNKRGFNVDVQGVRVLTNYDVFANAGGCNQAVDKTFTAKVTNGILTIGFSNVSGKDVSAINAIEIVSSSGYATSTPTIPPPTPTTILTPPPPTTIVTPPQATPTTGSVALVCDFNGDRIVNIMDITRLLLDYNPLVYVASIVTDVNGDHYVNSMDYSICVGQMGRSY